MRIDRDVERIQVKTTTVRERDSWTVWLSTTRGARRTYDPEDIDAFFIVNAQLDYYLIPVQTVGGFHAISLNAYSDFLVKRGRD